MNFTSGFYKWQLKQPPRIDIGGFAREFEKLIKQKNHVRRNG